MRFDRCLLLLLVGGALLMGVPPRSGWADTGSAPASWTGVNESLFEVEHGEVGWAQTFVDVLQEHGIEYGSAIEVARQAGSVFDLEDLRAGNAYHVYVNPWLEEAQYLMYDVGPAERVVFDLQNPDRTRIARRPVEQRWTQVSARIDGSLYQALVQQDVHPVLVLRLSEVFAWQVDFFRLRAGDSLRVLYEQRTVDGEAIIPGEIIAAYLKHRGTMYHAFRFEEGGEADYYDEEGQSLRRQLLKAPLRYTRISSGYSERRFHPVLREYRPHRGVDYAAPRGTPVRAVGNGLVTEAQYDGPNGNYVKVRHNGTYTSAYLHLSGFAEGVHPGTKVKQGETIGYVGSTGRSTGPHLDYRLWRRDRPVDPTSLDLPPSHPVQPHKLPAFQRHVRTMRARLHQSPIVIAQPSPMLALTVPASS